MPSSRPSYHPSTHLIVPPSIQYPLNWPSTKHCPLGLKFHTSFDSLAARLFGPLNRRSKDSEPLLSVARQLGRSAISLTNTRPGGDPSPSRSGVPSGLARVTLPLVPVDSGLLVVQDSVQCSRRSAREPCSARDHTPCGTDDDFSTRHPSVPTHDHHHGSAARNRCSGLLLFCLLVLSGSAPPSTALWCSASACAPISSALGSTHHCSSSGLIFTSYSGLKRFVTPFASSSASLLPALGVHSTSAFRPCRFTNTDISMITALAG